MEKPTSGPRPMGLLNALLAFALSAAMGVAFVMVVNKTHDLFSSAAFADWDPVSPLRSGGTIRPRSSTGKAGGMTLPAVAVTGREDS